MADSSSIQTAVIPVAGKGTRLAPVTRVVPKAMFPLVDVDGQIRTVLEMILAEVAAAGIARAVVVVSPGQQEMLDTYFTAARNLGRPLPERIEYLLQATPAGFGDAVAAAAETVGERPVLVMLGDHVHLADPDRPGCAQQVVEAFDSHDAVAAVGMQVAGPDELDKVGVAAGVPLEGDAGLYRCTDFVEKPDLSTARDRLGTGGLGPDRWLAHAGIYALGPEIFQALVEEARAVAETGKEVQLAGAQRRLLDRYPRRYLLLRIAGRGLDTGTPGGYERTQAALRSARVRL
jgi:UTP--glucose-1-phosphate uridylyltransferase